MIVRPRPGSDDHIVRIDGDEQSAGEHLLAWGWTDGLPIVVPTVARVEQMCAGAIHGPGEVLGNIAPRGAPLTVQHLAWNAVMAGCLPEYMPVLEALGVRVNIICPGMIRTDLNRSVWQAWHDAQPPEARQDYETWAGAKIRAIVPLGRWPE